MPAHDLTLVNVTTPSPSFEKDSAEVFLPLGCLYLLSALERAGISAEFRDYQLFAFDDDDPLRIGRLQSFLSDPAPVIGVSCMVSMLPFVLLGTRRFKEEHPDCTLVLGGPGPSGAAEEIVAAMPWVDVVVRGEGEVTLIELMRALQAGGDLGAVRGITWRDGSEVRHNPARPRIQDLDRLPLPAYHRVDMSAYTSTSVITGRGCPFRCAFCDVGPLWNNKTIFRGVDGVVDELRILKERYGKTYVKISDDTFDLKRDRTEAFCDAVGGLDLGWSCLARIDLMNEDLLAKMAGAGCDSVFLGIESGSDRVLEKINKRFTIMEATKMVEMSSRHFEHVITSFIWGFPFETMDDLKSTVFSIFSMWQFGAMAGLKLLSPMPLSQLGIEYRDRLVFSEEYCSVFASLGNVTPGGMSERVRIPGELTALIRAHPGIFAGFFHVESDDLKEKKAYLDRFARKMGIRQ